MATLADAIAEKLAPSPRELWPWLYPFESPHVSQWYNPPVEYGVDIALPLGTPVTSLVDGQVRDLGYLTCPGGVVAIECLINGEIVSQYYQHLDVIAVRQFQHVRVGQVIGYSGGQLSGGHHPNERLCSEGPHVEIGINAPWGGVWHPLGPNRDPTPWIRSLISAAPLTANPAIGITQAAGRRAAVTFAPGFQGIAQAVHYHEEFQPAPPFHPSANPFADGVQIARNAGTFLVQNLEAGAVRMLIVLAGVFLILLAMWAAWQRVIVAEAHALDAGLQSAGEISGAVSGGNVAGGVPRAGG